jgi:ubiquinone/menaquinone biosynthesis C-methylase UbiE
MRRTPEPSGRTAQIDGQGESVQKTSRPGGRACGEAVAAGSTIARNESSASAHSRLFTAGLHAAGEDRFQPGTRGYARPMTGYVHGYGTPEQERLVEQAEHWRHGLIRDGTRLEPGTRLLEVGCGAGAVLAVLGQEFPGVSLVGVDIEPKQLAFARGHLERAGVEATVQQADAHALPFEDESFDHVWMMWFLEHIADPPAVLREARRVLVTGGRITAIEVDYSTCRAEPSTSAMEALFRAMVQGMAASGWSDAGTRLPGWLREAGFREVDEGERPFWWQGEDLASQARYAADVMESALDALAQLPDALEEELLAGLEDLRDLSTQPGAGLGWIVHKSTAVR